MKNNNIIFVGGIHGVGKTTLCNEISEKLKIENYSSSALIAKLNSEKVREDKKVVDIEQNQDILIKAINTYLFNNQKKYILDGHFCLINNLGYVENVPIETFKQLNLKAIIIVTDSPERIITKLELRDGGKYSLEFIKVFQEKEIAYAKSIAEQLGIQCIIINMEEKDTVYMEYIQDMLKK